MIIKVAKCLQNYNQQNLTYASSEKALRPKNAHKKWHGKGIKPYVPCRNFPTTSFKKEKSN